MCRSIRQLRRAEDTGPATTGEARAAALQYVRKVSGFREPSARNGDAFRTAVEEIAAITERLLLAVGTPVAEGADPFADPVTRRAILAARPAAAARRAVRTAGPAAAARRAARTAGPTTGDGPEAGAMPDPTA